MRKYTNPSRSNTNSEYQVFQFNAKPFGHYVEKPKGVKSTIDDTMSNVEEEQQGIKRNAVLNSPSKVGSIPRDPKKHKSVDHISEDILAEAEPQPRLAQ